MGLNISEKSVWSLKTNSLVTNHSKQVFVPFIIVGKTNEYKCVQSEHKVCNTKYNTF